MCVCVLHSWLSSPEIRNAFICSYVEGRFFAPTEEDLTSTHLDPAKFPTATTTEGLSADIISARASPHASSITLRSAGVNLLLVVFQFRDVARARKVGENVHRVATFLVKMQEESVVGGGIWLLRWGNSVTHKAVHLLSIRCFHPASSLRRSGERGPSPPSCSSCRCSFDGLNITYHSHSHLNTSPGVGHKNVEACAQSMQDEERKSNTRPDTYGNRKTVGKTRSRCMGTNPPTSVAPLSIRRHANTTENEIPQGQLAHLSGVILPPEELMKVKGQ